MKKNILVTGGAGFIGSNFIHYIFNYHSEKFFVINLDKLTYAGNLNNLKQVEKRENYRFIKGDICNEDCLKRIFEEYNIDYVVNFAAESHVDRSIKDPSLFIKTNILGTEMLLTASKKSWSVDESTGEGFQKGKKFLQISTDEVYGSLGEDGYFTEKSPIDSHSPYAASKASADLIVKAYYDTYKMPINITRCSNNYGPYQFPEKFIPLIINNCLKGKHIPLYGDGKNVRDWLYVEDHCKAIYKVLTEGTVGEIYNIGGHNEKRNEDIIKLIIKLLRETVSETRGISIDESLIKYVEDRKGHDRRYAIDPCKIKKELNWESSTTFQCGIEDTVKWYLNNESWLNDIVSGEYEKYYREMYK